MSDRVFDDRPRLQAVPSGSPRPVRLDESPSLVAGELETELRRALQRAKTGSGADAPQKKQEWDPIFVAQEMRHSEPVFAVPPSQYMQLRTKSGSKAVRNVMVASLSALLVGFAAYEIGSQWQDTEGGGGGGGGAGGGQTRSAEQASLSAPMRAKDQSEFVQTGYSIQPLINPGNPTDLSPADEAPRTKSLLPQETATSESTASFRRDMEEARKLFDRPEESQAAAPVVEPEPVAPPAQIAAVTPARISAPEKAASSSKPTAPGPSITGGEEGKLMQRATDLMQRGDITGARLLFEHLAFRGSAIGAFALAQSYDQKYLAKFYVRGLTPDQKQADYWYKRAAELGGVMASSGSSKTGR